MGKHFSRLTRAEYDATIRALKRLNGKPFQSHDFYREVHGRPVVRDNRLMGRLMKLIEHGAVAPVDMGADRTKHRFYRVVDITKWKPLWIVEPKAPRAPRADPEPRKVVSSGLSADRVREIVTEVIHDTLGAHGEKMRSWCFFAIPAVQVAKLTAPVLIGLLQQDKAQSYGIGELPELQAHYLFSSAHKVPSVASWKAVGCEIGQIAHGPTKHAAERAMVESTAQANRPVTAKDGERLQQHFGKGA